MSNIKRCSPSTIPALLAAAMRHTGSCQGGGAPLSSPFLAAARHRLSSLSKVSAAMTSSSSVADQDSDSAASIKQANASEPEKIAHEAKSASIERSVESVNEGNTEMVKNAVK